jgi:hypothetical protein
LGFFGRPIVLEPSHGQISGDAGLLPVPQFDERIGLTRAFADALDVTPETMLQYYTATAKKKTADDVLSSLADDLLPKKKDEGKKERKDEEE